jgi:hypothetical protein
MEKKMASHMKWFGLMALLAGMPAAAQPAPVIDNDRVTVWDIKLALGVSGPATSHNQDTVIMFLEGGQIRSTDAAGHSLLVKRDFGDAVFVPRGTDITDTLLAGGLAHEIVVALKDQTVPTIANTTGLPVAFPRPGSVKVLDNNRVSVWHYSWMKNAPTPMHFHDKDVVVAYRYDGAVKSVTPDSTATVNSYKAGEIRFNKANRTHYEELATDRESAVIMELK